MLPYTAPDNQPVPTLDPHLSKSQPIVTISDSYPEPTVIPPLAVKRSSGPHKPPPYLQQYHYNQAVQTDYAHPISNYLSYNSLSPSYQQFMMQVSAVFEP